MCIPPANKDSKIYFAKMIDLLDETQLEKLSMGMSGDYLDALNYSSSFIRVGSKIFGERF